MKGIKKFLSIIVLIVLIGTDFLNPISYAIEQEDLNFEVNKNTDLYNENNIDIEDDSESENKDFMEEEVEEELNKESDLSIFEVDENLDIKQDVIEEKGDGEEEINKNLDDEVQEEDDIKGLEITKAREILNNHTIEKSEKYNNVTVSVRAAEGTFPEGTYVKIIPVKGDQLGEVKERIFDENGNIKEESEIIAFDIKFEYELGDGRKLELQPLSGESVQIKFDYSDNGELKQAENEENKDIVVYHINNKDENGEIVKKGEEKVEKMEINNEESEKIENGLVIDAEKFSIYVLTLIEGGTPTSLVVTLDSNGGYFIESGSINVSDGIGTIESEDGKVILPFATKYTHGLLGWYLSGDEENLIPAGSGYEVTENVTLYAKWEQCAEGYSINANWQCECIEGTLLPNGKCDIGLINLSVFGYTGYLMEKNLGATAVFNGIFSTGANGMNEDSFGKYYQWGNNYGFDSYTENAGQLSSSYIGQLDVSGYDWDNPYISGIFLKSKDKNTITWMKPVNYKLWGGQSNLADKKQGPCPVGYHVPSSQERVDILTAWSGSSIRTTMFTGKRAESRNFAYDLKLPFPGYRARTDTKITDLYILGRYCSSTPVGNTDNIYLLKINENTTQMLSGAALEKPANGFSVRCLKNTVDGIRTVIFDSNRGTLIDDQRVPVGNKLVKPEDPQLPGYVFLGWYKDAQFSELWDFETDEVMENITLYAKWNYIQNFDDLNLVFLSNEGGPKYTTIMDRNLGATEIFNGQIGLSNVNVGSFGYQYQWGNNYGFEHCNSLGCTDISNSSGYLSSSVFRSVWAAYIPSKYARNTRSTVQNWMGGATINDNIWGGAGDTISENGNGWVSDRQGPCPDEYYVPSVYELSSLSSGWSDSVNKGKYTGFISDLLLPPAGVRNYTTGEIAEIGDRGVYWSSSPSSNSEKYAYFLNFKKDNADVTIGDMSRSSGRSVRCVKSVLKSDTTAMKVHVNGGKAVITYTGNVGNGKFIKLDNLSLSVNNATFEGWYSTPDFAVGSEITLQSQIPSDLYAKITCNDVGYEWDGTQCKNGVKLIFNSMGGSYVPFQIVESGTTGYKPEDPIKTGSVFMGWFLDGATNEFNFTGTVITGETTLYAHWNEGNYAVTFNSNGGSAVVTQNVAHGDMAIKPEDPTRENSHFEKWQLNGVDYDFTTPVVTNITLDAVWTCNTNYKPSGDGQLCEGEEVSVTIDGEDDGLEHHYGEEYTLPTNDIEKAADTATVTFVYGNGVENRTSTVTGTYTPNGWLVNGTHYEGSTIILVEDITLTPDYTLGITPAVFPEDPTREHYIFGGWFNGDQEYTGYNELVDITLTARWTGENITVTFDANGGSTVFQKIVNYGSIVTEPNPIPKRAHSMFVGWFVDNETFENQWMFDSDIVTVNITLFAKWICDINYESAPDGKSCIMKGDDSYSGSNVSGGGGKGGVIDFEDDQHGSAEDDDANDWIDGEDGYDSIGSGDFINQDDSLYKWAKENWITTMDSFEKSDPEGLLTRGYLAKMVVNYMVNVLGREIPFDVTYECVHWGDNPSDWESEEIRDYATKACAFGVMGINMENNEFLPNNVVTRAEFGTVVSRMLWGGRYNITDTDNRLYYEDHLNVLKRNNIIIQIENPEVRWEVRKWVWLVFRRVSKKFKK